MEDFTFSKDWRALWKAAKKINNVDSMDLIFNVLCDEVGLSDPERDQARASYGKEAAERMNLRGKGPEAKKL
jgi:hypothetical protein